jgi:hypothetical protein
MDRAHSVRSDSAFARLLVPGNQPNLQARVEHLCGSGQRPDLKVSSSCFHFGNGGLAYTQHLAKLGLRQTALFAKGDQILLDAHFGESFRHTRVESRIL